MCITYILEGIKHVVCTYDFKAADLIHRLKSEGAEIVKVMGV